jgi:ATPase subunit of ABC transporter with duplicated ATPase domains
VPEFIYTMKKARKAVGDKVILDDVTMMFYPGAKIGVVGPNGAGKSTILKIMAGLDQPSNGEAYLTPGYSVGLLAQEPVLDEDKSVLQNVQSAFGETYAKLARFNAIAEEMATDYTDELMEEMGKLQEELDHANAWDLDSQLDQAMDALRCPPGDMPVSVLSGGERRRVALCRLLLSAPDLLLLDEPTNHLDAESVQWLEQFLSSYPGAVLAVTHDRYFLDNVAGWIAEVDRGRLLPYEGNYSTYLEKKAERMEVQGRKDAKLAKRLQSELAWVRSGAKARQAKSKARLARYEEMAAEAERTRKLDFEEIQIPPGPRLGSVVVEVDSLRKGFDDRVLIDGLSFTLPRNGIVGVIGPNGAGKTTLFNVVCGFVEPSAGSMTLDGQPLRPRPHQLSAKGIVRTLQGVGLFRGLSVVENVMAGATHTSKAGLFSALFGLPRSDRDERRLRGDAMSLLDELGVVEYAAAYPDMLPYAVRKRVALARALVARPRLLLLDEPAGGLSAEDIDELATLIVNLPGRGSGACSVMLVEHHMDFVMKVCHEIVVLDFGRVIASGTPREVRDNPAVAEAYLGSEVEA